MNEKHQEYEVQLDQEILSEKKIEKS